MQGLLRLIIALFTVVIANAEAAGYWEACNSCSQSQQVRAATRAVPARTAGQFDVYLMDFERVVVQKYRVTTFYEPRDGGYHSAALAVATEAHIVYEFEQVVRAIKDDVASFEAGTAIPEDVAASAFDIIHDAVMQRRVSDYVNEHLTIWQSIGAPAAIPLSALGKIVDLNFVISVTFSDGSTAKIKLTGIEGSMGDIRYTFELVENSARDADGNLIPANATAAAPYQGLFSTQAFAERMTGFITGWYSQEGTQVVCRSEVSDDGIVVICKRR